MLALWRVTALLLVALVGTARGEPRMEAVTFTQALGLVDGLPVPRAKRQAATRERATPLPLPWQPLLLRAGPSFRLAPSADRGLEGGVSLEQPISLGDVRATRRALHDALAAQHEAEALAGALEARLEIAASWIAGWAARERLAAATRDRELARAFVALSERARTAGALTAHELADAQAFLAEKELQSLDAEGEVADAAFATARSAGRTTAIASAGELPTPDLPSEDTWDGLVGRVRTAPAATARRIVARAARARAAEERTVRRPQLVLGASVDRDGPGALVTGVTIGIAWPHDRGEREAHAAETTARLAEADAEMLASRAAIELAAALHEVEHTGAVVDEVVARLVPATESAAALRQRAFDAGEATIVELLAARRAANAAHLRATDARAAHAWARVRALLLLEASGGVR